MTQLAAAKSRHEQALAQAEEARQQVYAAIRTAAPVAKQVEIVKVTGYTREHIRKIVDPNSAVGK